MYKINPYSFNLALKHAGFNSISDLAKYLGVHKNSIYHYLSDASVFPTILEKIFEVLGKEPFFLIERAKKEYSLGTIVPLIDALQKEFSDCCFVLFGSRAKGKSKRFSDFDIGVYSQYTLSQELFLRIFERKCELEEDLPIKVDMINLNEADRAFIDSVRPSAKFLGRGLSHWLSFSESNAWIKN